MEVSQSEEPQVQTSVSPPSPKRSRIEDRSDLETQKQGKVGQMKVKDARASKYLEKVDEDLQPKSANLYCATHETDPALLLSGLWRLHP